MEKEMEVISLQYDLFNVTDCPSDFIGVMDAILNFSTSSLEIKDDLCRDKKFNASSRKICKALKCFSNIFGYRNLNYYRSDDEYLDEQLGYVSKYGQCLNRMIEVIDDENYADIYELALFSHEKFLDNISNVDCKRENLDCEFEDKECVGVRDGDFETFLEFFDCTLEKIEFGTRVVYEKK